MNESGAPSDKPKVYEVSIHTVLWKPAEELSMYGHLRPLCPYKWDFISWIKQLLTVWSSHVHKTSLKIWACSLFTLQLFCTSINSCSLTLQERIYLVSIHRVSLLDLLATINLYWLTYKIKKVFSFWRIQDFHRVLETFAKCLFEGWLYWQFRLLAQVDQGQV